MGYIKLSKGTNPGNSHGDHMVLIRTFLMMWPVENMTHPLGGAEMGEPRNQFVGGKKVNKFL